MAGGAPADAALAWLSQPESRPDPRRSSPRKEKANGEDKEVAPALGRCDTVILKLRSRLKCALRGALTSHPYACVFNFDEAITTADSERWGDWDFAPLFPGWSVIDSELWRICFEAGRQCDASARGDQLIEWHLHE